MGCNFMSNCDVYGDRASVIAPNPNPINFEIIEIKQVGRNVVAKIKYPDCINFEGMKICVFQDTTIKEIQDLKLIDPHFSWLKYAPFARFLPTTEGWDKAIACALII